MALTEMPMESTLEAAAMVVFTCARGGQLPGECAVLLRRTNNIQAECGVAWRGVAWRDAA